jgi:hypothetical protein
MIDVGFQTVDHNLLELGSLYSQELFKRSSIHAQFWLGIKV